MHSEFYIEILFRVPARLQGVLYTPYYNCQYSMFIIYVLEIYERQILSKEYGKCPARWKIIIHIAGFIIMATKHAFLLEQQL